MAGLGVWGDVAAFADDISRGSNSLTTGRVRKPGKQGCIGAAHASLTQALVPKTLLAETRF